MQNLKILLPSLPAFSANKLPFLGVYKLRNTDCNYDVPKEKMKIAQTREVQREKTQRRFNIYTTLAGERQRDEKEGEERERDDTQRVCESQAKSLDINKFR